MSDEPLSRHCSLMAHPERTTLPADCPEGAVYIRHTDEGGDFVLDPVAPFPIVIEGGKGEDKVTVIGTPANPVLIDGGEGNDSVRLQGQASWLAGRLAPEGMVFLGALLIVFATIAVLGWRALSGHRLRAE
jgi:hypothetical protein